MPKTLKKKNSHGDDSFKTYLFDRQILAITITERLQNKKLEVKAQAIELHNYLHYTSQIFDHT